MHRHSIRWNRSLSIFLSAAVLLAGASMAPTVANGAAAFADLSGHWAATPVADAVAAGYVNGYPDGTFRPDAQVTRAEFVKLMVKAGGMPLRPPGSWQIFNDVSSHWVEQQAYLDTAGAYGIVIESDYYRAFQPDRTLTRLEAAVQAVRVLGRHHEVDGQKGDVTVTDGPAMPLWERRYIQMAMQAGIITGYPDNTFRDQQPISRAEAAVIATRTARAMKVGETAGIKLTVNGKPVTAPVPLSIRAGYVYAPADAIYGGLGHTTMSPMYDSTKEDLRLLLFPGNESFGYERSRTEFPAGAAYAYLRTADSQDADSAMQKVPLLAPTYLDQGRLMIPVAGPDGQGSLPYATAHYDSSAATAAVTTTADWPGNRLPQSPATAAWKFFRATQPFDLQPGQRGDVPLPGLVDANGDRIYPVDPNFAIHVTVDPASPMRLRAGTTGALVTSLDFVRGAAVGWPEVLVDPTQNPVPEGTWNLTFSAPGYPTAAIPITVVDHRVAKLAMAVTPAKAGQLQTITVQVLDSKGRVVNYDETQTVPHVVWVTLPDGSTTDATVASGQDPITEHPWLIHHGVGTFTFTPATAGVYHYAAHLHLPTSSVPTYGDFDAAADVTVGS